MLTDSHCHITSEYYDNIEEIINNALSANIKKLIVSGCDIESNKEVLELANKYDCIYFTMGCHPENVRQLEECLKIMTDNINNKKFVAVGEIGLDYHWNNNYEEQQLCLKKQLDFAKKHNKSVVIHSRDAYNDTYNILNNYNLKGVIHSFSGSLKEAKSYINIGYYLGINGIVTFKNSNTKDILKDLGVHNIILETDSPYLTPCPYRGKKNEPSHIKEIALYICDYLAISINDLSNVTEKNISAIFDI